jgi:hypothetical protein
MSCTCASGLTDMGGACPLVSLVCGGYGMPFGCEWEGGKLRGVTEVMEGGCDIDRPFLTGETAGERDGFIIIGGGAGRDMAVSVR